MALFDEAIEAATGKAKQRKHPGALSGIQAVALDGNEMEQKQRRQRHEQRCLEYDAMRDQNSANTKKMDKTKKVLKEYVKSHGVTNKSGNTEWETPTVSVELQRRGGGSFVSEVKARMVLAKKPKLLAMVVKTQEYIDEAAVRQLYVSGLITKDELLAMEETATPTEAVIISVKGKKKKRDE